MLYDGAWAKAKAQVEKHDYAGAIRSLDEAMQSPSGRLFTEQYRSLRNSIDEQEALDRMDELRCAGRSEEFLKAAAEFLQKHPNSRMADKIRRMIRTMTQPASTTSTGTASKPGD